MKNTLLVSVGLLFLTTLGGIGCSSAHTNSGDKVAYAPSIVNPRTTNPVIAVGADLKPAQIPEVLAEVKDPNSKISDVRLRLNEAADVPPTLHSLRGPIDVPMENVEGTTYRAKLSEDMIKRLAINGESIHYTGNVIAKNDKGLISVSDTPIDLTVQTSPTNINNG